MFQRGFNRLIDIICSLCLIILSSPLWLVIALLVKVTSTGEIIFKQGRLGRLGKVFYMFKFRTMVSGAEKMGSGMYLEENDSRVTPLGKWLRKTSLDEIPQLLNVLRGDMSMVGPRPAPLHHLSKYNERQRDRLKMKPGITGWAQIKGRNEIFWPERIEYDLWYLKHQSFFWDMFIMFYTFMMVFSRKGVQGNPERREKDPFNQGF